MADFMNENESKEEREREEEDEDEEDEEDTYVDEDEEYSYKSEDDELLPSLERAYSDEIFIVPEGGCVFVNYKDMYPNMLKLVNSVTSVLGVDSSTAELLLQAFQWNQENLIANYFQNAEKALIEAHAVVDPHDDPPAGGDMMCFICMDDFSEENGPTYSMACGHKFHRTCYAEYIENGVSDGPTCVEMTCPMYKCSLRIPSAKVKELCENITPSEIPLPTLDRTTSGSLVPWGSKVYESFVKHLIKNFIQQSSYMRWCPAPGCVFISVGRGVDSVECRCTFVYCIKCQKAAHAPAPCALIARWTEKNQSESENANWLQVNTKPCPKCKRRIEKNNGCNHMTCSICRHGFCWICLGNWSTHDGSYYNCNKFQQDDGKEKSALEKTKVELERYIHNFTRYENHRKAYKIAQVKKNELYAGKFAPCQQGTASLNAACVKEAFEQVVECRRALQNSYVVGHYAVNGTAEHQLFEFQQQMLESNTEALNHMTEKLEVEEINEDEMFQLKNLTGVTKKFMSLMMTADDMEMKA